MRVAIGSDHNGVEFKAALAAHLSRAGHEVIDVGPETTDSVDYPDYAFAAAERVASGEADRAVLICGSGIGMCIAANKVRGIRAALCHSPEEAEMTRRHNDANVLTLAGWRVKDTDAALAIVDRFLETGFDGGRHARRVGKIEAYEKESR